MSDTPNNPLALVIEDDRRQATIFAQALRQADYETEIITDGAAALVRLAEVTPTLVVLDLHLPYISGEEILRHIRADERLAGTRVMLATANPQMATPIEDKSDLVLHKPVSFQQLSLLARRLHPDS